MKREPLKFHIPEPKHRPGDEPDFSDIEIPAAGSLPRPEIDTPDDKLHA